MRLTLEYYQHPSGNDSESFNYVEVDGIKFATMGTAIDVRGYPIRTSMFGQFRITGVRNMVWLDGQKHQVFTLAPAGTHNIQLLPHDGWEIHNGRIGTRLTGTDVYLYAEKKSVLVRLPFDGSLKPGHVWVGTNRDGVTFIAGLENISELRARKTTHGVNGKFFRRSRRNG